MDRKTDRSRAAQHLSHEKTAPGAFVLRVPRRHDALPGQMVAVTTDPDLPPRWYSIASGREEPWVEILYTLVDDGALTPRLSRLREGDTLYVSEPSGSFTDRGEPAVWIAAGTGVAPFASMVRSGITEGRRLIHGSRTVAGFYYTELFERALGARYVRCSSGETAPGIVAGRLTRWLREEAELPREAVYYLCGGSGMVVDVRDILIERGIPYDRVVSEIYF